MTKSPDSLIRLLILVLIIPILVAFSLVFPAGSETLSVISDPAFVHPEKPKVLFNHDMHNEKAAIETCQTCHHVYKNGRISETESSEDRPCSACHQADHVGRGLTLASAFHKQCRGCHLKQKKGPFACGECHKKPVP